MRRKLRKKIQNASSLVILGVILTCGATAWATISLVQPGSSSTIQAEGIIPDVALIPDVVPADKKSRAPEPATMVLFGSGFLGMAMSVIRKTYAGMKRVFDIIAAVIGIVVLAPVMLLAAIVIRCTSRGPVVYSQVRVGKDGELFTIYKFRSMRVDAEKETGAVWASQNDNRITPVGRFLRKSRIDELPQFFNILKGDMSLIGPRPERPEFVEKFKLEIPGYERRLSVKPGITGLAQVWHRYDETIQDVKKKVRYDTLYIKKMCLWADFGIFLRTFRVVLTGEGAK